MKLNRWIDAITYRIPNSLYQILIHRNPLGLFYHSIGDEPQPLIQSLYEVKTKSMFERDLGFVKRNYHLISGKEIVDAIANKQPFKTNSLHVSFDDGMQECFEVVRPLLKKYDIPCTFFITTNFIDNHMMFYRHKVSLCIVKLKESERNNLEEIRAWIQNQIGKQISTAQEIEEWMLSLTGHDVEVIDQVCEKLDINIRTYLRNHTPYLTTDQIRQLAEDGFTIGAHSKSHRLLSDLSFDELEDEIVGSCLKIQEITQKETIPFSFPFYGHRIDNELLYQIAKNNQEVGLFFDSTGMHRDDPYILDRIWADAPEWDHSGESNVKSLINLAYRDILLSRFRNAGLYQ